MVQYISVTFQLFFHQADRVVLFHVFRTPASRHQVGLKCQFKTERTIGCFFHFFLLFNQVCSQKWRQDYIIRVQHELQMPVNLTLCEPKNQLLYPAPYPLYQGFPNLLEPGTPLQDSNISKNSKGSWLGRKPKASHFQALTWA